MSNREIAMRVLDQLVYDGVDDTAVIESALDAAKRRGRIEALERVVNDPWLRATALQRQLCEELARLRAEEGK